MINDEIMLTEEQLMEWMIGEETSVFGNNSPQCRSIHEKSHIDFPETRTGVAAMGLQSTL
jgi:hypothetical protein